MYYVCICATCMCRFIMIWHYVHIKYIENVSIIQYIPGNSRKHGEQIEKILFFQESQRLYLNIIYPEIEIVTSQMPAPSCHSIARASNTVLWHIYYVGPLLLTLKYAMDHHIMEHWMKRYRYDKSHDEMNKCIIANIYLLFIKYTSF